MIRIQLIVFKTYLILYLAVFNLLILNMFVSLAKLNKYFKKTSYFKSTNNILRNDKIIALFLIKFQIENK
jgi:hypothetical protein